MLVLRYGLQRELKNTDHVSLMLRKCDHRDQRSVNVQTCMQFISVYTWYAEGTPVVLLRLTQ